MKTRTIIYFGVIYLSILLLSLPNSTLYAIERTASFSSSVELVTPSAKETYISLSGGSVPLTFEWRNVPITTEQMLSIFNSALDGLGVTTRLLGRNSVNISFSLTFPSRTSTEDIVLHINDTRHIKDIVQTRGANRKTLNANWIQTKSFINSAGTDYNVDITYYDWLGYPVQTIAAAASPLGKSIVSPVYYDTLLRDNARIYLPYISTSSTGEKQSDIYAPARYTSTYGIDDNTYAYTENTFAAYELNRILSTRNSGKVMNDYDKRAVMGYSTVTSNDSVRKITTNNYNSIITISGYHSGGSLFRQSVTDEDGKCTVTFTDQLGRTILIRSMLNALGTQHADTYYVYDSFGRVAWVISPEGSARIQNGSNISTTNAIAVNWCYIYLYDGMGRIYEKYFPGHGAEYFVYDKGGRIVLVQDAVQRTQNRWIYTVYDNMGRAIEQSLVSSVLSRSQIQAFYDRSSFSNAYPLLGGAPDARKPLLGTSFLLVTHLSSIRYGGGLYRNTPTSTSTAVFTVPTALSFLAVTGVVTVSNKDSRMSSLKTYEKHAILNGSTTATYVERAFYYDSKERLIQMVEKNYFGGVDRTSYQYDFSGNILKVHESHKTSSGATAVTKLTTYTYDSRNRLLSESTQVNSGTVGTVSYSYDELGRKKTKTYGNGITETITYTTQGWIKSLSNTKSGSNIFSSTLGYYDASYATKLYSGNISESQWQQGASGTMCRYQFGYDLMGRLKTNAYRTTSLNNSYCETGIKYDLNGNILRLKRYGSSSSTVANNMTYTYLSGNKVSTIADASTSGSYNYTYDANGNMISDGRQGVNVTYNLLNLPLNITSSNGTIDYRYLMDGTLLFRSGSAGSYYYLGSLIFTNSSGGITFESTSFGGGRIVTSGSAAVPQYFTTDHLGSVRVITNTAGTVLERNDYYPFGKRIPNSSTTLSTNRFRYNGKELQAKSQTTWIDYGARMYDDHIGRWTTQDPMSEKYYGISPYAFCIGNPILLVDSNGQFVDDYLLDRKWGIITLIEKNDNIYDNLFSMTEDGNVDNNKFVKVEKGVLSNIGEWPANKNEKGNVYPKHWIKINNDNNALELFEFVVQNSCVEWALTRVGKGGMNILTTSHNEDHENGAFYVFKNRYSIREVIHSHPYKPSPSDNDIFFKNTIQEYYPKSIYSIYYDGQYYNY